MSNLGDLRVREFIHPDSLGMVKAYDVEMLHRPRGKYAKPDAPLYWKNMNPSIEPFTDKAEAEAYMAEIQESMQ